MSDIAEKAARPGQLELAFDLYDRDWFSLKLAAQVCGMSETFIEKKFDEDREISGHAHNAGRGRRETKRIPRIWLVTYMLTTARYDLDALVTALVGCFRRLSSALLARIRAAADEEICRRSSATLPHPVTPTKKA